MPASAKKSKARARREGQHNPFEMPSTRTSTRASISAPASASAPAAYRNAADLKVLPAGFLTDFVNAFSADFRSFEEDSDESVWARESTLNFIRNVRRDVPFAAVYKMYLTTLQMAQDDNADAAAPHSNPASREKARLEAVQFYEDAKVAPTNPVFAADGKPTDAEWRAGRAALNRTLFREYGLWWDAFIAESAEDPNGPLPENRFALHCAKILSKRVDGEIAYENIMPLVSAWLLKRNGLC